MLLPIVLLLLAAAAVSVYAFGTAPAWGAYAHGLSVIVWSRRLELPLIVLVLLLSAALAISVISGKNRAWWLVGLIPVLGLCMHRMSHAPGKAFSSVQDPLFIVPAKAASLPGTDLVVGVIVEGKPTAFPCTSLYRHPIVVRTGREKPMVLFWSPWANRALAFYCDRDLRASDLEVVSTPDNSLLIYNSRLGEFVNGITGRTISGAMPTGIHAPLDVVTMAWQNWQMLHPDTVVAAIPGAAGDFSTPFPEKDELPGSDPSLKDPRPVCVVATTQPIAIPSEAITSRPLNLTSGQSEFLLVRVNGIAKAYDRELPGDLIPRFSPFVDPQHKNVAWIDSDTNSEWTDTGVEVEGPKEMHGVVLKQIPVEDEVYWNVMKFWYPQLQLASDADIAAASVVQPHPAEKPAARRRRGAHGA